ncbi:DNA gyrase inhibitor YacG [Paucibacter sp. R3-3]|uniref:DNA gyrase inhibitor YacG n=1 Tax=Roseateles agri TaxID=3098619 RepID=A0ABU5DDF7_9BURK|nr:DNA gyrase inhibitor YacG [Paucibacter sp. R3-3]MDY0744320.1 DNA gyrase inhibitor YacG [Paucibacter sp. R3-3]
MKANDSAVKPRIVRCPTCGGDSVFAPSNLWRPFCSERCRQIDLGAWASESYAVEAKPPSPDDADEPLSH